MTTFTGAGSTGPAPDHVVLRAAIAAYLGRYRGESRLPTESDLRVFLRWCTDRPPHHHALRPRPKEPRPAPNYILAAYMASGT